MFKNQVKEVFAKHEAYKTEVGLLFMADNLSKTDIIIEADTDEDIANKKNWAEDEITRRKLNPKLIKAVLQRPVNVAVAKEYFRTMYGL